MLLCWKEWDSKSSLAPVIRLSITLIARNHSTRRSQADEIYKLGIARKAKPLERLKLRYNAFNIRMATPLPPNLFPPPPPALDPSTRTRSTLGTLAGSSSSSLGSSSSSRPNGSSRKGGMAIFVDGGEGSEAVEEDERRWHGQLGTRDEIRKENERESTAWRGETLPQGRGIAPRTPKLEIFKDNVRSCSFLPIHPGLILLSSSFMRLGRRTSDSLSTRSRR